MNMNFNNIKDVENEVINKILKSLCKQETELFLVGGYIRDLLLDRTCYDRDYTIKGENACEFAQKVAEFFQGYYVTLDKELDIARVVMPDKKNTLDFAGCFKQNIYEDLKRRDYIINAIAYRIDGSKSGLIDPFNGINDLKEKTVRAISEENLIDDPLRLLRAFRVSSQLDFNIENKTLDFIATHKTLINNVSAERISAELIKLFESAHTAKYLILMKKTELLYEILPELLPQKSVPPNLHHHLHLIDHSIEVVNQIENNKADMPEWFKERLEQEPAANIKIISLLKLAGLFHDVGKPLTWQIDELGRHRFIKHEDVGSELSVDLLKRLKLSKNSIKYITTLIKYHLYPSQLLTSGTSHNCTDTNSINCIPSEKAILRMFRKINEATPDVILLAMADRLSARGPEITEKIIENNIRGLYLLLEKYKESLDTQESLPKLLSGNEVMEILNIPRSPLVGKILGILKEAQISGDITDKNMAIIFIKEIKLDKAYHEKQ